MARIVPLLAQDFLRLLRWVVVVVAVLLFLLVVMVVAVEVGIVSAVRLAQVKRIKVSVVEQQRQTPPLAVVAQAR
jgi:hypothetical protein